MLRLYNTLTRKVESFEPLHPPEVTYYSCGPTVYDYAHIGHARTFVFADILQRVLEFNKYTVKRVMNITDVGHLTSDSDTGEDKMELASRRSRGKGAVKEGKSVWDIATYYTDDFFHMLDALNIKKPEPAYIPRATKYINQMIAIVKQLESKGCTYTIGDGVYFDTTTFPQYGILTGQSFQELQKNLKAGARVEVVPGKRHPMDFALWKLTPKGVARQMEWDSPWGRGFPGWHIECTAMSMELLGESIDIHTGGVDHIPIHHTNEIAQSEAATGKQFVRFWLHGEHLLIDGKKMSKSLGNFYRLKDIEEKGFSPLALRYLFLTANYRTQMNFTWKSLEGAQQALESLKSHWSSVIGHLHESKQESVPQKSQRNVELLRKKFVDVINDDLNTAQAISVVWEVVKSSLSANEKHDALLLFDEVLGLGLAGLGVKNEKEAVPKEITALVQKREQLRKEKKWDEADQVRKQIEEKGYSIEDIPTGTHVFSK